MRQLIEIMITRRRLHCGDSLTSQLSQSVLVSLGRQHTPFFSATRQVVQPSSVECRQQLLHCPQVTLLSLRLLDKSHYKTVILGWHNFAGH